MIHRIRYYFARIEIRITMPRTIVKVYFNNGCSSLAYDESTTIQVSFVFVIFHVVL